MEIVEVIGSKGATRLFYRHVGYDGEVRARDRVFVAREAGEIVGAVRLCTEWNEKVLRGMQVSPGWQQRGVGTKLLEVVVTALEGQSCFGIAPRRLDTFYLRRGNFRFIDRVDGPGFLQRRLDEYRSDERTKDYWIMYRGGRTSLKKAD